ncbi:hypothetical protein PCASD_10129 [Puccinia coronata f. sp. avenae]|uniref:Uncharacterized protein n=1 Tax=Puccinia coronata f. sp. avenae TaxID=200324 RepID=A0A2N5UTY2_9BASI|nr:hypothetical protein PCASD_10129 [Puccinia coronata f. sp. avenae]
MPSQPEQGDGSRHLLWDLEQETPNHNASTNPERVRVNLAVLSSTLWLYVHSFVRSFQLLPCTNGSALRAASSSHIHTQEDPTSNP